MKFSIRTDKKSCVFSANTSQKEKHFTGSAFSFKNNERETVDKAFVLWYNEGRKAVDVISNAQIMKKHLEASVIQPLLSQGFTGKYPHFRRQKEDCIELITFQANRYHNSFTVEVSAIFPDKEEKNFVLDEGMSVDDVNVWYTNNRYRLKGMYDGWFYHRDVYSKYIFGFGRVYLDISEINSTVPKGYKLVQQFNDTTADKICDEVNKQLIKAFEWLQKFEKSRS